VVSQEINILSRGLEASPEDGKSFLIVLSSVVDPDPDRVGSAQLFRIRFGININSKQMKKIGN
jgi:hypothetical protein